jgi:hypothetical protein
MEQEDFLVARNMEVAKGTGTVELQFQHALSRVVFNARSATSGVDFIVKDVALLNLNSTGTLNFETATLIPEDAGFTYSETSGTNIALWDPVSSSTDYELDMGGSKPLAAYGDTYTPLHSETNAMLVMPHATTLGAALATDSATTAFYVRLKAETSDGQPIPDVYLAVKDVKGGEMGIVFEAGRQYTFNINIAATLSKMSFSVVVSDWNVDAPTLNNEVDPDVLEPEAAAVTVEPLELGDFWPYGSTASNAEGIVVGVGEDTQEGNYVVLGITNETYTSAYQLFQDESYTALNTYMPDIDDNIGGVMTGGFFSGWEEYANYTWNSMNQFAGGILYTSGGYTHSNMIAWVCALSGVSGQGIEPTHSIMLQDVVTGSGDTFFFTGANPAGTPTMVDVNASTSNTQSNLPAKILWYFVTDETDVLADQPTLSVQTPPW